MIHLGSSLATMHYSYLNLFKEGRHCVSKHWGNLLRVLACLCNGTVVQPLALKPFLSQGVFFDSNNPADCLRVFFICEYPPVQVVENKAFLVFLPSYPMQTNSVCLFFQAQGKADVLCALVFQIRLLFVLFKYKEAIYATASQEIMLVK